MHGQDLVQGPEIQPRETISNVDLQRDVAISAWNNDAHGKPRTQDLTADSYEQKWGSGQNHGNLLNVDSRILKEVMSSDQNYLSISQITPGSL